MSGFRNHTITKSKTVGDKLKEARLENGLALERVAKELGIAFKYLDALEKNKFREIPGELYVKKFLSLYAHYLHLDYRELIHLIDFPTADGRAWKKKIGRWSFISWPRLLKNFFILLLVAAVAIFLIISVERIFLPPELVVLSPENNYATTEARIEVVGRSQKEAQLLINNRIIFVDDNGNFSTEVDLQSGVNFIKIIARKRYSRPQEITLRVLLTD